MTTTETRFCKKICPNCQQKVEVPDEAFGMKVECPTCHQMFTPSHASDETSQTSEWNWNKAPKTASMLCFVISGIALLVTLTDIASNDAEKVIMEATICGSAAGLGIILGIWATLISINENLKK